MGSTSTMSSKPRERALHELLSRDMVDIYVGPSNTHWILHEKLLCHRSRFFRDIFYNSRQSGKDRTGNGKSKDQSYGLPDEDDSAFKLFVGWLYSERIPAPKEEKELGALFDVYLMGEKWEIQRLILEVLDAVRRFYHETDSWPSLRRVQYVYANTEAESPMRILLVQCVARMLVVGSRGTEGNNGGVAGGMPSHWEKALRKNGQLAVDVIMCVQKWRFEPESVPDARIGDAEELVDEAEERRREAAEEEEKGDGSGDDGELLDWGSGLSQSQTEAESERTA